MSRRSQAADGLAQQHGRWRDSPTGRRARLSTHREARLRRQGTTMVFYGKIRISSDERRRGTTVTIDGPRMDAMLDASLAGNDTAALARLEDAFGDSFGGSVTLIDIEQLDTFG